MARKRKAAAVVFSLSCVQASSALALGLGELKLDSFLNQPLNASVDLLNIGSLHGDEIKVRLATREDFDKLGLERSYFLTSIQFEVVHDDGDRARIVLTTDEAVLEPYLDFIIEARWPSGRLLREYTVLVDPPVFSDATPVVSASQRVEEVEGIPDPAKKKAAESASGTRVDVRKSDLPPGAMPDRDFNAATASTPTPGSRYMIPRDQTLWDIASKARPEGATVHQTMLDIQRLNPNAFINGNINRVKAGYIVYLPTSADISYGDAQQALAEVKEQNAAWEQGRDAELHSRRGPALRISADPEPGVSLAAASGPGAVDNPPLPRATLDPSPSGSSVAPDAPGSTDPRLEVATDERLSALEQQLETLQRIVELKDEQIAALQGALSERSEGDADSAAGEDGMFDALEPDAPVVEDEYGVDDAYEQELFVADDDITAPTDEMADVTDQPLEIDGAAPDAEEEEAAAAAAPAKPAAPKAAPPAPVEEESGWLSWALYGAGALIFAVLGFLFLRGRNKDDEVEELAPAAPAADVFSDIELPETPVQVEEPVEEETVAVATESRGYGERRHDEYASDVEAADALAEADIYIAYGRHPQAIDLLNNALANEPGNPVYRLKLLEIHNELNDKVAAQEQLREIRNSGDASAIAQAEALISGEEVTAAVPEPAPAKASDEGPGLAPNPLTMMEEDTLEADFEGLEIEDDDAAEVADDLDLSADFEATDEPVEEDEELVIAADANGLSTKLDLARAYIDMGDDDGARQILDEIVAEGSDELKAEAQTLLDRIG